MNDKRTKTCKNVFGRTDKIKLLKMKSKKFKKNTKPTIKDC